jgi:hypothetical protein
MRCSQRAATPELLGAGQIGHPCTARLPVDAMGIADEQVVVIARTYAMVPLNTTCDRGTGTDHNSVLMPPRPPAIRAVPAAAS